MKNLEKQAIGIVAQLFDLAEVPVDKRQQINDVAYDYVTEQLIITNVSQQREQLIDFVKWFETLSAEELVWYDGKYAETFMAINCG